MDKKNFIKSKNYDAPLVEIIDVKVEAGFANSGNTTDTDDNEGGIIVPF